MTLFVKGNQGVMTMQTEKADTIHGRLLEAVHISGYTFERACTELEWLLENERWKTIGEEYEDIDSFLATIDFSAFKIAIEQRKKLAKKLTDLRATQRATAKALGVDHKTISRDVGENSPQLEPKPAPVKDENEDLGENSPNPPPPHITQSGLIAAKAAAKAPKKDRERKTPSLLGQTQVDIRHGDFRLVLEDINQIAAIITDPPYGKASLELWRDLGLFAAKRLADHGVLIAYSGQMYLPQVLDSLNESLDYFWTMAVVHKGSGNLTPLGHPVRKVINQWKAIVFFCKKTDGFDGVFRDLVPPGGAEKEQHNWAQPISEAIWLIEQFTQEGDLIVDPFSGSGTIGSAAKEINRNFIGAEIL